MENKICEYCGIEYILKRSRRFQKFCSHKCSSENRKGKPSPLKGIPRSPETKLKISKGNWKGGRKIYVAKSHNIRRKFGFIPLNDCSENNWVGHHLDLNYVIFIPEELHKSIYHSLTKNINMSAINDKVNKWVIEYYLN